MKTTMKRRYTIEYKHSGQTRPYGPTLYDYTVTCELHREDGWGPVDLTEGIVDQVSKALGEQFYLGADAPSPFHPILKRKEKLSPGVWRYVVEREYCG